MATFDDFMKLDIRVGTIIEAKNFEKVRKPAYQLLVDFGEEIGLKDGIASVLIARATKISADEGCVVKMSELEEIICQ